MRGIGRERERKREREREREKERERGRERAPNWVSQLSFFIYYRIFHQRFKTHFL